VSGTGLERGTARAQTEIIRINTREHTAAHTMEDSVEDTAEDAAETIAENTDENTVLGFNVIIFILTILISPY
jgi:hypothetical protein